VNRIQTLLSTGLLTIESFDHPPEEDHVDPPDEQASGFAVNFIDGGSFRVSVGRSSWEVPPGAWFCTAPGLVYRCQHPPGPPTDSCLTLSFSPHTHDDLYEQQCWPALRGAPVIPLSNRRAYIKQRLLSKLDEPVLSVEEFAVEVLESISGPLFSGRGLYRETQLSWYARRVERARERLDAEYSHPHTLESLARDAGMSPYHFARIFAELTGLPPHRYLLRRRLQVAARLLRDGLPVTETCFASGFSNLSHFVRSFRRAFGQPPSRWRSGGVGKASS